jgi:hypothetical protein
MTGGSKLFMAGTIYQLDDELTASPQSPVTLADGLTLDPQEPRPGTEPLLLDLVEQGYLLDGTQPEPPAGTICISPPVEHGPAGVFRDGFEPESQRSNYMFTPYRRGTSPHPLDCGT